MSKDVQKRVIQLLQLVPTLQNPNNPPKPHQLASIPGYKDWVADLPPGLSEDQQNLYLFMRAATYPDTIKHEWLQDSDTPPANVTADMEVNIGFTDKASHGYWHFVDAAIGSRKSTPEPNAATQIVALRKAIATDQPESLEVLRSRLAGTSGRRHSSTAARRGPLLPEKRRRRWQHSQG